MQIGVEFMGNIPRSLGGSQHFTLTKVNRMHGMHFYPRLFQCGCHMLGWRGGQKVVLKLNLPFSGKLNQLFFDLAR